MSAYQISPYLSLSQRQTDEPEKGSSEEISEHCILITSLLSSSLSLFTISPFHPISRGSTQPLSGLRYLTTIFLRREGQTVGNRQREREREFRPGWKPRPSQFRGSLVDSLGVLISLWKWSCSGADVHRNLPYSPGVVIWRVTGCTGQWGQRGSKHEGSTLKFVCPVVAVDGKVRFSAPLLLLLNISNLPLPPLCHILHCGV